MEQVYVKTDVRNRILMVDSGAFLDGAPDWTEVDQGEGDRFLHAQNNYLPAPLFNKLGVPLYVYNEKLPYGARCARRAQSEIEADMAAQSAPPPSQSEINAAHIDYLAMMCNIEWEE